jgi:hypothetical protein
MAALLAAALPVLPYSYLTKEKGTPPLPPRDTLTLAAKKKTKQWQIGRNSNLPPMEILSAVKLLVTTKLPLSLQKTSFEEVKLEAMTLACKVTSSSNVGS